ncbi:MAG: ABC transporter ATP-binding protein [Aquabacterium sp.]|nr:MAG: ABC transporter ATP-binding protein [Aquabacterium sp.]
MTQPVLRLSNITKRFGSLVANDGITLELQAGEILALLGENGAGKSTLVSILFGHYVADAGSIEAFGRPLPPGNPRAALAAGIGMVHQHFALADNLSVLDNILIGAEPLWQPFQRRRAWRQKVVETAQRFGLRLNPDARVADLSVGERQRVEIVKALVRGARILILDEPTAVLTPQESESLFATLHGMVRDGLSIIFISHKLAEVQRVSDRVAVLRGGKLAARFEARGTTPAQLAEAMVGRAVERPVKPASAASAGAAVVLRLDALETEGQGATALHGVTLALPAGRIVGIAGVSGNGQQTLAEVACGQRGARRGSIELQGRALRADPRAWIAGHVARVPEDRTGEGVVGDLCVWENAITERLHEPRFSRWGWVRRAAARAFASELVRGFDVRLAGIEQPARQLSGGNMQKLILGRALSLGENTIGGTPALIVANQPTWGLDIGAVTAIHQRLIDAAARGSAVLLISEDLDELFAVADEIAVMHHGRLTAPRAVAEWTLAELGLAMAGTPAVEAA